MITIHKKIFYEVFDKNIDLYNDFISSMNEDYNRIIKNISNATSIEEIRRNIHSLIGIISVLETANKNYLLYRSRLLLLIDKNDKNITLKDYEIYIQEIINYDKSKLGL
jgi:DNA-directed RNA polymerase